MNIRNQQQQGRRRGRGGPRPPGQGGVIRPEQNARLDNRSRGNAAQQLERYKALARDATQSGDRITAEYYHQYADHYFRVLNENRPRFEEQRPRQDRDWQDRNQTDQEFGDANYAPASNYDRDDGEEPRDAGVDRDARSVPNDRQNERQPRTDGRDNRVDGGNDRQPRADRDGYEQRPRYAERPRGDSPNRDSDSQDRASTQEVSQSQDHARESRNVDREQRASRRDRWNGDQPRRDVLSDRATLPSSVDDEPSPASHETVSTATDPAFVRDVAPPPEPIAEAAPRRGRPRRVDTAPVVDDPFATRRAPSKPTVAKPAASRSAALEPAQTEAVAEAEAPRRRATRRPRREEPDSGAELSLENV